jgi:hypothetical protein
MAEYIWYPDHAGGIGGKIRVTGRPWNKNTRVYSKNN